MLRQAMEKIPEDNEIWLLYHQFCGNKYEDFVNTCEPYLPQVPKTSRLITDGETVAWAKRERDKF